MIHEERLLEAIRDSGVSRIAIVDDAFDPPEISELHAPKVLEFLEAKGALAIREELKLTAEIWEKAILAIKETNYASDELVSCVESLYNHFVTTLDDRFDPGGVFIVIRGANLRNLRPLLELLKKCGTDLQTSRVGSRPEDLERVSADVDVVFVDFYLNPNIAADANPSTSNAKEAKNASLTHISKLMRSDRPSPSVVLMSSHAVRDQAEAFREQIDGAQSRVFASRFAFIEKTDLTWDGKRVELSAQAADALLDIFQSYNFGRVLNVALNCWLDSASKAVSDLKKDIEALDLREFAYLMRFRLATEGQELIEYLEWFFGECLLDGVTKAVDTAVHADPKIAGLDQDSARQIEGAFDGPTVKVAELYHRVRIENAKKIMRKAFRLGDIYLRIENRPDSLFAVMTPDCDLSSRGKKARAAPRMLTISGILKKFDAPETSVANFVIIDNVPYNIAWDTKSVETREFGDMPGPGASNDKVRYLGALRPLYAQELQRNVLHDLGRVGVFVPPAIGLTASVKVTVAMRSGKKCEVTIPNSLGTQCYLIPSRGGNDKGRVIFKRQFIPNFLFALSGLDTEKLSAGADKCIARLKEPESQSKLLKMTQDGVQLETFIDFNIFLTGNPSFKSGLGGAWCWLTVSLPSE